eukprot:g27711.t1
MLVQFQIGRMELSTTLSLRNFFDTLNTGQEKQSQVGSFGGSATESRDYTQVPQEMDAQFEKLDPDSSLRPTIINIGNTWKKRSQKALLAEPTEAQLTTFDLLDAITKSGALPLSHATLHIVIAATHCFDKTVLETVVQENVNPIEKEAVTAVLVTCAKHWHADLRRPTLEALCKLAEVTQGKGPCGQQALGALMTSTEPTAMKCLQKLQKLC